MQASAAWAQQAPSADATTAASASAPVVYTLIGAASRQPVQGGAARGELAGGASAGAPSGAAASADAAPTGPAGVAATGDQTGTEGFISVRDLSRLEVPSATTARLVLPADTFQHSSQQGDFTLTATLADGSALPSWLRFDAATGAFDIEPRPAGSPPVVVRVVARDRAGRMASAELTIGTGA